MNERERLQSQPRDLLFGLLPLKISVWSISLSLLFSSLLYSPLPSLLSNLPVAPRCTQIKSALRSHSLRCDALPTRASAHFAFDFRYVQSASSDSAAESRDKTENTIKKKKKNKKATVIVVVGVSVSALHVFFLHVCK